MKYFLDTEFFEDGKTIDLLSIGIVAEDGREFYAVNAEADYERISNDPLAAWLRENVMPSIIEGDTPGIGRHQIRDRILAFVSDDPQPQFWGYFADYDWIVFCQLFGRMIDLPKGFPMYCRDIKQEMDRLGVHRNDLPQVAGTVHNALDDARWNREAYQSIASRDKVGV